MQRSGDIESGRALSQEELLQVFRLTAVDYLVSWAKLRALTATGMPEAEALRQCPGRPVSGQRLQILIPQVLSLLSSHGRDASSLYDFQHHIFVGGDYGAAKLTWQNVAIQLSALRGDLVRSTGDTPGNTQVLS